MTARDLRSRREKMGLTQRELAARLDTSERTVIRWESGEGDIPRVVDLALKQIEREDRQTKPARS